MKSILSNGAAPAIGPYSQGIQAGQILFISGQIPLDPSDSQLVSGGIKPQTHRVLKNLGAILKTAGVSFEHVVRTTVFLTDLQDFEAMNEIYSRYFSNVAPARSTVQVSALPKSAMIEIDAIAIIPKRVKDPNI